jgi:hypothetical protein
MPAELAVNFSVTHRIHLSLFPDAVQREAVHR